MKKRDELGQVRLRLAAQGLRSGLLATLKAQERALLREIAEIEVEFPAEVGSPNRNV